jgi:hypothetical protein
MGEIVYGRGIVHGRGSVWEEGSAWWGIVGKTK